MKDIKVRNDLNANYKNYYESGDSEWRRIGAHAKANNITLLCRNLSRNSIIEIGAGEGSVLKRLSELDFAKELYALEISSSGVETIKKKGIPQLIDCRLFDGYLIPYDDNRFDVAILSHVIEHVEYPRRLLYEASRIAKYIFVEVPLEDIRRLPNDFVLDKTGHINFYSLKTMRRLLQSCNLKILGQIVTNPSKEAYVYQKGKKGLINYFIKELFIKLLPGLAMSLFVYHAALICENIQDKR